MTKLPLRSRKRLPKRSRRWRRLPMRGRSSKKPAGSRKVGSIDPEKLLAGLVFDDDAAAQIIAANVSDLFGNDLQRDIADAAIAYFRKHGKVPGEELYESRLPGQTPGRLTIRRRKHAILTPPYRRRKIRACVQPLR